MRKLVAALAMCVVGDVALAGRPHWDCQADLNGGVLCWNVDTIRWSSKTAFVVEVSFTPGKDENGHPGANITSAESVDCQAWTEEGFYQTTPKHWASAGQASVPPPNSMVDALMQLHCPAK